MFRITFISILLLSHIAGSKAQQDFNNFKPLQSVGNIPSDFFVRTSSKIEEDMKNKKENLNVREPKIFLEGIHYGIDEILQSGLVIYGDEISEYVTKVAHKLLEKDSKLRKQLRFYTIKSNQTNAFSTDQGIVFVTTGLISQITSEAQLAFVLAHEIAHYVEKHVVETFEYRTRNRGINSQIQQLSVYSQEKEFEADVEGVKMYYAAGYSDEILTSTFDVLMYSYLPIDEIPLPRDYFNSDLSFVPEFCFPDKEFPIKVDEDYDDSRSSHPNIRKRKLKAIETAENYKDWGKIKSHFGEQTFFYIRNLARFERVRSDIIEFQFADALYTIYILEQEFPNSLYLTRMKAQCWYGLSTMKHANKINQTVMATKDLEGEGAVMHAFVKNLKELELASLATRIVEDSRSKFPDDLELKALSERTNRALFNSDRFEIDNFYTYNFQVGYEKFMASDSLKEISKSEGDTLVEEKKLSKYDKIKLKKRSPESAPSAFDSTDYYYYMLSDLVKNEIFKTLYTNFKIEKDDEKALEEAYNKMTRSEKLKFNKEKDRKANLVDLSSFILVDPAVISYRKGKVDHVESEKMEERVVEGFEYVSEELGLKITTVGRGNLEDLGTEGFNQKSFFTSMLIQSSNARGVDIFPVDYSMINSLTKQFGTNKLVFSVVEHAYRPRFSPYALYFIFFPPGVLGYLPVPFIKGNETEINLIVLDLEKAKVVTGASYYINEPLNQFTIEARLYDIFLNKNSAQ